MILRLLLLAAFFLLAVPVIVLLFTVRLVRDFREPGTSWLARVLIVLMLLLAATVVYAMLVAILTD